MKKLANIWPHQDHAEYICNGDVGLGKSIDQKAQEGETVALSLLARPGVDAIFLAGYSQGAAAAILVAQALQRHGHDVTHLALLDGVSADPKGRGIMFDPEIPPNVKSACHAYRNPTTNSRPLWGNCGMSIEEKMNFWITHGGASGTFYLQNPSGPPNPLARVTETGLLGETHVTNVTQYYEWESSVILWDWFWGKIRLYYQYFASRPPKGKPGLQPAPAPGNPNNGTERMHVVKPGESLSLIAGMYWNDVLLWPILYDRNKSTVGPNPNLIQPGMRLVVPSIKGYSPSELTQIRQRGRSWR